jgi:hypothetical protein
MVRFLVIDSWYGVGKEGVFIEFQFTLIFAGRDERKGEFDQYEEVSNKSREVEIIDFSMTGLGMVAGGAGVDRAMLEHDGSEQLRLRAAGIWPVSTRQAWRLGSCTSTVPQ